MSEIDKIKRRINKRKVKVDINNEVKDLSNNGKSSSLFKVLMGIMTVYALFVSVAIYAKKDENAIALNKVLNTNINFTSFNKSLNKLLDFRIIDNSNEYIHDSVVSSNVTYLSLGDDYYTSEGNLVVALYDGVITYVNGKDESYTIIVEYDCGVRATYDNMNEVNVFVNDRIYSEDILGSYTDKVKIIFIKDSSKISYEEVISII